MLKDKVTKFYTSEYDLNCAETILYAANEEYNLNLSKETFKTMAAFGGGMAVEGTCGVVTGSITVLGLLFTKERAHESDRIKLLTQEYIDKFNKILKTENCLELKNNYRTEEERCAKILYSGAEVLDEIVTRERKVESK